MRRPVLSIAVCLVAGTTFAVAQNPPVQPQPGAPQTAAQPARDKASVKSGTGVIKGRVLAADGGAIDTTAGRGWIAEGVVMCAPSTAP